MSNREVISDSFIVHFQDGTEKRFIKGDSIEYIWSLTPAGDLLVYLKEYHKTFSMAAVRDERIAAYAAGVWKEVESRKDLNIEETEEKGSEREESEVPAEAIIH